MQLDQAVGPYSYVAQREECHHLAPADTSIPLQRACVRGDATVLLFYTFQVVSV